MFKQRKFRTVRLVQAALTLAIASDLANTAQAETLGMVTSAYGNSVTVFDADTDTVLGSVAVPGSGIFDCAISADQTLGATTAFFNQTVYVIDPKARTLAAGTNTIPISFFGEDVTLSADQRYLLSTDGYSSTGLSVVDLLTRAEISTPFNGLGLQSVEACSDNTVLASSYSNGAVHRFSIDPTGALIDPSESLSAPGAFDTACAPTGGAGLMSNLFYGTVESVLYPPLTRTGLDVRSTSDVSESVLISPSSASAFVRTAGSVQAYTFDRFTGALGASPYLSWPVAGNGGYFGADLMAIHPNGSKLYVSEGDAVNVYNAGTGALITTMTDAGLSGATGVCLPGVDPHPANLRMSFTGPSTQFRVGAVIPVYARMDNYGKSIARNPSLDLTVDTIPAAVTATPPAGWTCAATGITTAAFHCIANAGSMALGSAIFTLRITAPASTPSGFLTVGGRATSQNRDPVQTNNDASFKVYVRPAPAAKPYTPPAN